jgi:GAF domain-containing protein
MIETVPSRWLAVGAETDPLTRARQLQRSWERLLAEGALGPDLPPEATAGLRPTIVESWRRSLATGLAPTEMVVPVEADQAEMRERWLEHPLGSLAHVLASQLRAVAEESKSLVVVTDASGLLLHIDGAEWLKERAVEMNFMEGARFSEMADGTNGIGTALVADHPLQVFAFEHFNQSHHQWICSGAPVHDPVSGQIIGLVDLSSLWKIAHPRSLELVTTTARTMERCLLDNRRDRDARLKRRYSDLMTRSTDLLLNRYGYVLDGDGPRHPTPIDVPQGGGEVVLDDGSVAVAEPLDQGEAYLLRRPGSRGAKSAPVEALKRAEVRARELAAEQAALRQVATLVARESSPDRLFATLTEQGARIFDVPLVRLVRFDPDGSVVLGGFGEGGDGPFPVGSRWPLDTTGVIASVRQSGRPARVQGYAGKPAQAPAVLRLSGMRSAVASPIVVEGRLWGAMVIAAPRREPLPEDTEARLADFTELVAAAIANVESRAKLSRIAEEQAALRQVATLVARGVRPDELFSAVTNEVGRLFGAEAATARFEADGSALVTVAVTEGIPVVTKGTRWPLEDFLASTAVYRTGRPARNDHTGHLNAAGTVADSLRQMNFVSTVAAPIVVEGRVWGTITVSDQREPLPADTEERVAKFTELVGTAIANAESRAELAASEARAHDLAREQAALRHVATLVAEGASAHELFAGVAHEVADVLGIPVVGLCRFEADSTFTMVGIAGETNFTMGSRWPVNDDGLAGMILATGRPARKDDYPEMAGSLAAAVRDERMSATVGVPIVVEGTIWGFVVGGARAGNPIPDGMEERLARFTELVATAIADSQSRQHLAQLVEEQAALRRVATLVAHGASQPEVFFAVSDEVGRLLGSDMAAVVRYDPEEPAMVVVGLTEGVPEVSIGTRWPLEDYLATTAVYRTGRPARSDHAGHRDSSGPVADSFRRMSPLSTVATPIVVEGKLWGVMTVSDHQPLPADTEERLDKFTELLATAIANADSRAELAASEARARGLAREQAALRRVATLVAEGAEAEEVFSAVTEEVEEVLDIPVVTICHCEPDGFLVIRSRGMPGFPVGSRWPWGVPSLPGSIYETGRAARIDDFTDAAGLNAAARDAGVKGAVGVPIVVGGTVWGSICAATTRSDPFPPDTEERLGQFRDLVATSISNAIMRDELAASRARVIAAADDARRRIERDLHDGAQQRLVTLSVALRRAEAKLPVGLDELSADLGRVADGLTAGVEELREISRGIHPAVLAEGGLLPALKALGRRSTVRVKLDVQFERRLPDQVEVAAYYSVAEALTNTSKHARATRVWVSARLEDDRLRLSVRDDGVGGADSSRGSGLIGLRDRIESLGGKLRIESPPGGGTRIEVEIPHG